MQEGSSDGCWCFGHVVLVMFDVGDEILVICRRYARLRYDTSSLSAGILASSL